MLSYILLFSAAAGIVTMVYHAARFTHAIPNRNEDFGLPMLG